jgi:ankyrin repeat protein
MSSEKTKEIKTPQNAEEKRLLRVDAADSEVYSIRKVSQKKAERLGVKLMRAIEDKKRDINKVNKLIKGGAALDLRFDDMWTILQQASANRWPEAVKALICGKADVNAKNFWGYTALAQSINANDSASVKILLLAGADVRLKDIFGRDAAEQAEKFNASEDIKAMIADALKAY